MASLFFVTGASQGIGRAIALETAKRCAGDAVFVLTARSETKLNQTKADILKINAKHAVLIFPLDLSKVEKQNFDVLMEDVVKHAPFGDSVLFNNAGQTGSMKNALSLDDLKLWHDYFHLNYFSTVALTISFVKTIKPLSKQMTIVNITSLAGRQPFVNLAMYGSGKAARDLYFRVLAKERPDISVLNYSPGPVDTDMYDGVIADAESEELRKLFLEMKEKKAVLTVEQTVGKLLGLLEKREFESGAIIDYYY